MGYAASNLLDRAQRFPICVPLQFRRSETAGWHSGTTINISRTGILFQTDEALQAQASLDVKVDLPQNISMSCKGIVVRCEDAKFAIRIQRQRLRKKA